MRFSTFSTGFSTTKGHQPYTHRNSGRSFLVSFGQKCGHSAFYKKESRRIFFAFYKPFLSGDLFFSNLEWLTPKFSTPGRCRFSVWKRRGKLQFSTLFLSRPNPLSRLRRQLPLRGKASPAPGEDVAQRQKGESGCDQREQTERVRMLSVSPEALPLGELDAKRPERARMLPGRPGAPGMQKAPRASTFACPRGST